MSSSYLSLCQKLRQEVGIAGTGPPTVIGQFGMLAKVVAWVADADMALQSKWLDWDFLWTQFAVNTISGTKDYVAPTDLGLWDEDSFYLNYDSTSPVQLTKMEYSYWRSVYPNSENDTPSYFVLKPAKDIILYSTPDAIYALTADYWKAPVRLAANTDVSPIPTRFDRLIIAQAKIYYAEHENAPEVMNGAVNEYNELLPKLEATYLPGRHNTFAKSTDNTMVIRPE